MITRPMNFVPDAPALGHSDATLTPLPYQHSAGVRGGYPAPIRRTKSYAFAPRPLPPVNKVQGPPRLYG